MTKNQEKPSTTEQLTKEQLETTEFSAFLDKVVDPNVSLAELFALVPDKFKKQRKTTKNGTKRR